jgi:hypothetical protein
MLIRRRQWASRDDIREGADSQIQVRNNKPCRSKLERRVIDDLLGGAPAMTSSDKIDIDDVDADRRRVPVLPKGE